MHADEDLALGPQYTHTVRSVSSAAHRSIIAGKVGRAVEAEVTYQREGDPVVELQQAPGASLGGDGKDMINITIE
ncbi:MAG: hypothetical protein P8182_13510 [Deltaproteobacteria bacterium]